MKYLFILSLLILTRPAMAQFEIGIGGGISLNSAIWQRNSDRFTTMRKDDPHKKQVPCLSATGSYNTRRWQAGITTGISSCSGKYHTYFGYCGVLATQTPEEKKEQDQQIERMTNPSYKISYVPLIGFINIKANIGRTTLYVGPAAGGVSIIRESNSSGGSLARGDLKLQYAFGGQGGVKMAMDKHVSFYSELAYRKILMQNGGFVATMPITMGLNYAFL